VDENILEIPK